MNVTDKYFFLLLVNSTNKNQKLSLLKSISPSQYKILKEITFKILNEIIVVNTKQLRKLKKHKNLIRKLGYNKVSGQVLAKNCSIVIEIVQIGLEEYEICAKNILVPKEEWEKINPQVKNVKQLHIPKREKNTSHHQKVVKNFPAKNTQMKKTVMKNVMTKNNINSAQKKVQVGKNLQKNMQRNLQKEKKKKKKKSYENSETEGNNTEKDHE